MLATDLDRKHCALCFELVPGCGKLRGRARFRGREDAACLLTGAGVKTRCRLGRRLRIPDSSNGMSRYVDVHVSSKTTLLRERTDACATPADSVDFLAFRKLVDMLAPVTSEQGRLAGDVSMLLQTGRTSRFLSRPES